MVGGWVRGMEGRGGGGCESLHLNPHSTPAVLELEGLEDRGQKRKRKREMRKRSGARVGNECSTNANGVVCRMLN